MATDIKTTPDTRRFEVDSWLEESGERVYELPLLGKVYHPTSSIPLKFWAAMNNRMLENGGSYSEADLGTYVELSLGEGSYDELLEAGITEKQRDVLFEALRAIHQGLAIGEEVKTEGDAEAEESGEA